MNREQLEARRAEFTVHRANNAKELGAARERVTLLQATDNTLHGVIQDCEHWLAQQPPEKNPEQAAGAAETASIQEAVRQAKPQLIDELQKRKAKREGAAA